MEESFNLNFGATGQAKEVFTNENLLLNSDLDFFAGEELAINGQSDYDIAAIALDIEHNKTYDTSIFSDSFHVEESFSLHSSPLNSAIELDSDLVDQLTGVSDGLICNSGFEFEHCATETVLDQAVQKTTTLLQDFSQHDNLEIKLEEVFGETSNIELAQEILRDIAQEGSLSLPTIEVLDSEDLKGADGAYAESTETIYLSQGFLTENQNSPVEVTQVLVEEFGHHLDAQINDTDTSGDEGAIFADNFNLRPSLSAEELIAISVEDDSSTILVGDQLLFVENNIGSYPGYIFEYEAGQSLSYDTNVEDWQQAMNDLGWNIGVDGLYGSESKGAALAFQQENTDLVNDGIVGENTWNKILDVIHGGDYSDTINPSTATGLPTASTTDPVTIESGPPVGTTTPETTTTTTPATTTTTTESGPPTGTTTIPETATTEDSRLGTEFRTEGIPIFDSSNDKDEDGLNDEWENIALLNLNPVLVFDEDEDLFDEGNIGDRVNNYTRITPHSLDDSQYILFMHSLTFSRDYGWGPFDQYAHDGDTESVQVAWEVVDDFTIELRSVRTRGHKNIIGPISGGNGDPITTGLNNIEISPEGSIEIYIEENKHGTFASKEQCESEGPFDCGGGRIFQPKVVNVGEPPEVGDVLVDETIDFPGEFVWSDAENRGGDNNFIEDGVSYIGKWLEDDIKAEALNDMGIG